MLARNLNGRSGLISLHALDVLRQCCVIPVQYKIGPPHSNIGHRMSSSAWCNTKDTKLGSLGAKDVWLPGFMREKAENGLVTMWSVIVGVLGALDLHGPGNGRVKSGVGCAQYISHCGSRHHCWVCGMLIAEKGAVPMRPWRSRIGRGDASRLVRDGCVLARLRGRASWGYVW